MKTFLALMLAFGSLTAFAEKTKDEGKFEDRKAKLSMHLEQKIATLQEAKSCVSGAKDEKTLKACHEKMREQRKERRDKMKEKKREKKHKNKKEEE